MLDLTEIREFLKSQNVRCLNVDKVACKIAEMRKDGYSKLQVRYLYGRPTQTRSYRFLAVTCFVTWR